MSRSAYCKVECPVCGRRISTAGFASHAHKMKHVREGRMRIKRLSSVYSAAFGLGYMFEVVTRIAEVEP